MHKKHFYSHIVEIESLEIELETLNLAEHEKKHLIEIAGLSLHQVIIDEILSRLGNEDKKVFLGHLARDQHDLIWKFLSGKIEDIEKRIKQTAQTLKTKLHADIKEIKKSQPKTKTP